MRRQVLAIAVLAALSTGCNQPQPVQNEGTPAGYVSQADYDQLQARFDALLKEHRERTVDLSKIAILQGELVKMKAERDEALSKLQESSVQQPVESPAAPVPTSHKQARKHAMAIEYTIIKRPDWTVGNPTPGQRNFDHDSGALIAFDDQSGAPRMRIIYTSDDQDQKNAATSMLINVLPEIGGFDPALIDQNRSAIQDWIKGSRKSARLEGGTVERSQFGTSAEITVLFF